MAAKPSRKNAAPLPISALPLPVEDDQQGPAPTSLPTNAEGKLSPAQRARLGLDIYGDDQPAAPTNGNGSTPVAPAPEPDAPQAAEPAASEFGFAEIDPFESTRQSSEPKLAPVQSSTPSGIPSTPRLAPANAGGRVQVRAMRPDELIDEPDNKAKSVNKRKVTVEERDGTPKLDRDRNVFTYGVAWTIFVFVITSAISLANNFSLSAGQASGPGPFIPGLIAIALGWVIVFMARGMGPNWVWLMGIPLVVLVLGPFVYSNWWTGTVEAKTRAYLSTAGAKATIDMDPKSIVSSTVDTPTGCFALTKDQDTGDVTVDVVTYAPATAQQQATFALSPRYARRVQAGGDRVNSRTFTMEGGGTTVTNVPRQSPPIDCAKAVTP
jgi:hypothetical protein